MSVCRGLLLEEARDYDHSPILCVFYYLKFLFQDRETAKFCPRKNAGAEIP
jgi:hypothetical protein